MNPTVRTFGSMTARGGRRASMIVKLTKLVSVEHV